MEEKVNFKIGDEAPDFTLKDQHNKEFHLSDYRGKRVLLSFHPLAWTGVCTKQMKSLEANYDRFEKLNTIPIGMSVDTVPTKHFWARHLGLKNLRMLADFWPHGGVAKMYGIFREKDGFSERANIIVDENGRVAFLKVYPTSQLPDIEEIINFLSGIK